jgi:leader peptidase (prepilin peptidase)/N-methyltransferase
VTLLTAELIGFLLGLLLGSFLNVCISRVPRRQSIVTPGSHCPTCHHPIRWYDNIPLISWLILRGKCRDCHIRIPWRYPVVELATGIWIWIAAGRLWYVCNWELRVSDISDLYFPLHGTELAGLALLGIFLIPLIVIDWQTQRLPDAFTLTGIATGMFLVCIQAIFLGPHDAQIVLNSTKQLRLRSPGSFAAQGNVFLTGPESLIFGRLAAVLGAALILLLIRWAYKALRHREGLGLGDVKLIAMVAAFLGFWPAILTLFLGVMFTTLYAVPLLLRRRANALTRLPFGSFLGAAGLFTALFGSEIIAWYTTLLTQ